MESVVAMLAQEDQDEEFDLLEAIRDRAQNEGWKGVLRETLDILANPAQKQYWHPAMAIIFWAGPHCSEAPIPKLAIVARLYWCLMQDMPGEGLDDPGNLIWSIAHELKGVSYNSDWDPQQDPEVIEFLRTLG